MRTTLLLVLLLAAVLLTAAEGRQIRRNRYSKTLASRKTANIYLFTMPCCSNSAYDPVTKKTDWSKCVSCLLIHGCTRGGDIGRCGFG
jgi:hypothetical protein